MTGFELRSITPLVPAESPTTTSIATPVAISHILGLAGRSVSLSELRNLTHSAISRHRSADEKLQCIREILSLGSSQNEQCGAVIMEAWSILVSTDEIWRSAYSTREGALRILDTAQLKEIRASFSRGSNRKDIAIRKIQQYWGQQADQLNLSDQGEHCLEYMARVAARFTFVVARDLGIRVAIRRLRRDKSGRGGMRRVTSGDWVEVYSMSEDQLVTLRAEPLLTASEQAKYAIEDSRQLLPMTNGDGYSVETPSDVKKRRRKWRSE